MGITFRSTFSSLASASRGENTVQTVRREGEKYSGALTAIVNVGGDVDRRVVVGNRPFEGRVFLEFRPNPVPSALGGIGVKLWAETTALMITLRNGTRVISLYLGHLNFSPECQLGFQI